MNAQFTAKAKAAVASNKRCYGSMDLLQNGRLVRRDIKWDEGSAEVTVDGTAAVRRTFSMDVPDVVNYLPLDATSLLSPFLTEIRVWAGMTYLDGTTEKWPIFTGAIEDPQVSDDGTDLTLNLTASDRAQWISEHRLSYPYTIAANTPVTTAIQNLLLSVRPDLTFNVAPDLTLATTPAMVIDELEDPWQHAMDLAAAAGLEVFFDGMGTCIIQPIPDPNTQAEVWTFVEGATAIIKGINQQLTAKESYSHAIVKGQPADGTTPIRSDAYDTNLVSPTYFQPGGTSAFGDKPVDLTSDLIRTQPQADAAAQALLSRKKGAVENVDFTCVPVTGFDEHDVVRVKRARLGIDTVYVLEGFNIPLGPEGEMKPKCRSRVL